MSHSELGLLQEDTCQRIKRTSSENLYFPGFYLPTHNRKRDVIVCDLTFGEEVLELNRQACISEHIRVQFLKAFLRNYGRFCQRFAFAARQFLLLAHQSTKGLGILARSIFCRLWGSCLRRMLHIISFSCYLLFLASKAFQL
jgi:hypothetical protein